MYHLCYSVCMALFRLRHHRGILTEHPLALDGTKVSIPVADIAGAAAGKTLLVTAGMDGDEYAGIEAAYQIIDQFAQGNFSGRIIVMPVVNIPGFEHESSYNPLDDRFPKNIFPGSSHGSTSEQLVHWLATTYAYHADAWIDLHGGSLTESIVPFIWTYATGVEAVDALTSAFHVASGAEVVVHEDAVWLSRASRLAKRGCMYALVESGERGGRDSVDINRHVGWVEALMREMGMSPKLADHSRTSSPTILRHTCLVEAPQSGIFRPAHTRTTVLKGEVLGTISNYLQSTTRDIVAAQSGAILWSKRTMAARKGDILYGIGYE